MAFHLTILGSNSALPAHGRNPSAQVLQVGEELLLFDCGEGTQMRLVEQGIRPGRISTVAISHLHGDHYFGLVGLLNSFHLMSRVRPLTLFAPAELWPILDLQMRYTNESLSYALTCSETRPDGLNLLVEREGYALWSFPLNHGQTPTTGFLLRERSTGRRIDGAKVEALGIPHEDRERLRLGQDIRTPDGRVIPNAELTLPGWKPRSYAYCSDTAYMPELAETLQGVDLLYHEATYAEEDAEKAALRFHSTARQAAMLARDAGVGRLLLGHFSSRYADLDRLLDEAREIFPRAELALEGTCFALERQAEPA
jgi:ribonuclease Z